MGIVAIDHVVARSALNLYDLPGYVLGRQGRAIGKLEAVDLVPGACEPLTEGYGVRSIPNADGQVRCTSYPAKGEICSSDSFPKAENVRRGTPIASVGIKHILAITSAKVVSVA